jgi:hypothetical protein
MDSVWNGAFETLYRKRAELTASLTTDEGYGNGNKNTVDEGSEGRSIDIEDLTSMTV